MTRKECDYTTNFSKTLPHEAELHTCGRRCLGRLGIQDLPIPIIIMELIGENSEGK